VSAKQDAADRNESTRWDLFPHGATPNLKASFAQGPAAIASPLGFGEQQEALRVRGKE